MSPGLAISMMIVSVPLLMLSIGGVVTMAQHLYLPNHRIRVGFVLAVAALSAAFLLIAVTLIFVALVALEAHGILS